MGTTKTIIARFIYTTPAVVSTWDRSTTRTHSSGSTLGPPGFTMKRWRPPSYRHPYWSEQKLQSIEVTPALPMRVQRRSTRPARTSLRLILGRVFHGRPGRITSWIPFLLKPATGRQHRSRDLASQSDGAVCNIVEFASIKMFVMAACSAKRSRITTESLETMGAPALASLLVNHAKVDPVLRRKLHLLLASKEGSDKLVAEIEKRIRTIGRSKSQITWERTKEIVQELDHLRETIAGQLASQDRMAAVELMWDFIGIADWRQLRPRRGNF